MYLPPIDRDSGRQKSLQFRRQQAALQLKGQEMLFTGFNSWPRRGSASKFWSKPQGRWHWIFTWSVLVTIQALVDVSSQCIMSIGYAFCCGPYLNDTPRIFRWHFFCYYPNSTTISLEPLHSRFPSREVQLPRTAPLMGNQVSKSSVLGDALADVLYRHGGCWLESCLTRLPRSCGTLGLIVWCNYDSDTLYLDSRWMLLTFQLLEFQLIVAYTYFGAGLLQVEDLTWWSA